MKTTKATNNIYRKNRGKIEKKKGEGKQISSSFIPKGKIILIGYCCL